MTNKITCKICSVDFKIITSAHVKHHGLTIQEYKDLHGQTISADILKSWTAKRTKNKPPKLVLDSTNAVECLICGQYHRALNLHLKFKHDLKPADYLDKFPGAKLYAESIKTKMKEKSFMKTQIGKSFEERLGKDKSDLAKSKIGLKATARQTGTIRTEEYKQKMRDTWENNRETWSLSIKTMAQSPEMRKKYSNAQKSRIERDGYHLARGKETSLERFVRETLEQHGFDVIKQKGTKKETLGTVRFFDIFVPELNLIIESDGEYWHRNHDRIAIDIQKTQAADIEGYSFLRISDKQFSKKRACPIELMMLVLSSEEERKMHSDNIISARQAHLSTNHVE